MIKGTTYHIPLEQAQTPKSGECLVDKWWSVHPEKGIAFYVQLFGYGRCEEPSPQCNDSAAVSRHLTERLFPDHDTVQLPVVYLQHAVNEMTRLRKEINK